MAKERSQPAKKSKSWIVLLIVGALATAGGAVVPQLLLGVGSAKEHAKADGKRMKMTKPAFVSFGDVVVNLNDGRLNRYLRVKSILVVDHTEEKTISEQLSQQKAILKN